MGKFEPESPTNLMVKTHGFPVKIFPTKPIQRKHHQKLRNWDFSLIVHETLGQYGTVIGFNQSNMEISHDLGHKHCFLDEPNESWEFHTQPVDTVYRENDWVKNH